MRYWFAIVAVALVACGEAAEPTADAELEWGQLYVDSAAIGRAALEESLVTHENGYARLRLENYGPGRAWNQLPVADPATRHVTPADFGRFDNPWGLSEGDFERLGSLQEWTHESVMAYGKRAFERYPLGSDSTFRHGVKSQEHADRFGLWTAPDGRVGGLVRVRISDSAEGFAPTCSTCHASVVDGALVMGRPNAEFDYDAMMLHGLSGPQTFPPSRWGAGAIDVTPDGVENPAAMADLRAVRHQTRLHWAGTIYNSLEALTVRIETLIITSLRDERPPREVAFAIAYYLWNLGLEGAEAPTEGRGRELFEQNCSACHGVDGTAGEPVLLAAIGTEPSVAQSSTRGLDPGVYRVPSLWGAGSRGQFLHHGQVSSLEELLDPRRLESEPGHTFGTNLGAEDRASLIEFVRQIGR